MTAALALGCGAIGLVAGCVSWVVIERVPAKRSVFASPFPELRAVWSEPLGISVIVAATALFAGTAARFGDAWALPAFLVLAGGLVVLSAIDLRHYVLPNRIVYPVGIATLALLGIAAAARGDGEPLLRALACGAGAFAVFLMLHLISPRSMGFGDVRLSFILGMCLGWLGVGETIVGLFLGFVYGAVIGVTLIATHLRSRKDHVPFGPFLAAGTMTAVLIGYEIVDWYRR